MANMDVPRGGRMPPIQWLSARSLAGSRPRIIHGNACQDKRRAANGAALSSLHVSRTLAVLALATVLAAKKTGASAQTADPNCRYPTKIFTALQRTSPPIMTPENLTYPWRFLSRSLPDGTGFDVEAKLVLRFGEPGAEGVDLLAETLHRLRVAWGAELVQMNFDQVSLNADVAAGCQQRLDDPAALGGAVAVALAQQPVETRFDLVGAQLHRVREQLPLVTEFDFVPVVGLAQRDLLVRRLTLGPQPV